MTKSVRDELAAAFDEAVDTPADAPAPEIAAPETTEVVAAPETTTPETPADTRARDESGRFLKKDDQAAPAVAKPDAAPAAVATGLAPAPDTQAATADRPPASLTVEEKTAWAKWPADAKAALNRREGDVHRGIAEYKEGHQFGTAVYQTLQPYLPMIQAQGGNPVQAIGSLLQTAYNLQTNPQQTLANLAQFYGVDLGQLPQQQQTDPNIAALQRELMQTKQQLQQIGHQVTQPMMNERLREVQEVENDPKNVYYRDVFPIMMDLVKMGRAQSAKEAYDNACWLHPQVRSAIQAQQQRDAEKKRIEEAQRQANAAKRASLDVSGTGSAGTPKQATTLRDDLERAFG